MRLQSILFQIGGPRNAPTRGEGGRDQAKVAEGDGLQDGLPHRPPAQQAGAMSANERDHRHQNESTAFARANAVLRGWSSTISYVGPGPPGWSRHRNGSPNTSFGNQNTSRWKWWPLWYLRRVG